MKDLILISTLSISILFFTSCSNKECLSQQNPYNGLYNALTCDYEARLNSITNSTSDEKLKNIELFTAYQELVAKVTNKEQELAEYKQNIQNTDYLIKKIELEIENMDTKQDTQGLLKKIRYQVISMKNNITTPQPRFSNRDIHFAKNKIKDKQVKKTKKIKLAEEFLNKNNESKEKLNQAYNKNYQENKKVQEELQKKLNASIRAILMSEKANHLNKENKERLMSALKETKRYTSKVK